MLEVDNKSVGWETLYILTWKSSYETKLTIETYYTIETYNVL